MLSDDSVGICVFACIYLDSKYIDEDILTYYYIHEFIHIGYNCEACHQALDGPQGLFACSSFCNPCALSKFRRDGDPFVEGTIRFYL